MAAFQARFCGNVPNKHAETVNQQQKQAKMKLLFRKDLFFSQLASEVVATTYSHVHLLQNKHAGLLASQAPRGYRTPYLPTIVPI